MNLYDVEKCRKAIKHIQSINTTTRVKAEHKSKIWEIEKVLKEIESINIYLYAPEHNVDYYHYYQAVNTFYHEHTKQRLDNTLKLTLNNICRSLNECIKIEYQTQDGTLVFNSEKQIWVEMGVC